MGLREQIVAADNIIDKISDFYGIANKDIRGKCRRREFVKARYLAVFFIKQNTDFTLKTIGEMFGRDHTSIIHALKTVSIVQSLHYDTDMLVDLKKIKDFI